MEDFPEMDDDIEQGGGAGGAAVAYGIYLVATGGLWWATASVHHGWQHYLLEALAIVFTALAVWAIGFVILAVARATSAVGRRRRSSGP